MKKFLIGFFVFILGFSGTCFAATVGNPLDVDLPPENAILRQQAVEETLNTYESAAKGSFALKAGLDLEFVFDKGLDTSSELTSAEIEGRWYMTKLGLTLFNRIEPYIKLGTSDLEVKWNHGSVSVNVEAKNDFAWGIGTKVVLWDFKDFGIRLILDSQYRQSEPDIDSVEVAGASISSPTSTNFKVSEWQTSLLASKKYELPLKTGELYIVPYGGITLSDSEIDVSFKDPSSPGTDYDIYKAGDESTIGVVIGCDIMPSIMSWFLFSLEVRLLNETALTVGGSMRF